MSRSIPLPETWGESGGFVATASFPPAPAVVRTRKPVPTTAYSPLIAAVFPSARESSGRVVQFVSAEGRAGVTRTACAVAAEMAASGRKVLLAEASVVASLSESDAIALCERVGPDRLRVLGPKQAARTGLERSRGRYREQAAATVLALSREYPYLVLDASSLDEDDAALCFGEAVATVLIVRAGRTESRAAARVCQRITATGSRILGCVYNDF